MSSGQSIALGRDLPRLTSLRAFAAFAVFAYHLGRHAHWSLGDNVTAYGFAGVGFFYVLSGFVLTWSTAPTVGASEFWMRRFARVYPSHFAMLLVALIVPITAFPVTTAGLATNALLIQAWFKPQEIAFGINAVSWSLACEAFFYLVAPALLIFARRSSTQRSALVLGAWFAAMSASSIGVGLMGHEWDVFAYTNPLLRSGEFVVGIVLATWVIRKGPLRIPLSAALAVLLAFSGVVISAGLNQTQTDVVLALPFALVIIAAASADLRGRGGVLTWGWLVYAGQVSFAYYLVHELIILNAAPYWQGVPGVRSWGAIMTLVMAAVCFGAAAALHEWVEQPCQTLIRNAYRRRRNHVA